MSIVHVMFVKRLILISILILTFCNISHAKESDLTMSLYQHDASQEIVRQYSVLPYNFIELIHIIVKSSPTSFDKLQKVFNKEFTIKEKSNDLSLYQLKNIVTKEGIIEKKYRLK